jgi:Tol biopolymer transport system component
MPPWFAEGVAQYQSPTKQTDCWDTHRDMILRAAILDDEMLSYEEMGHFGHGSLGNEQVYDHGYGLVRYIALTYGAEAIGRITDELSGISRMSIDGALKKVTGKKGEQLYEDWKVYLEARYEEQTKRVRANPREGWILAGKGNVTISPSFSPDGKRVAFLSNKGSAYARTGLYIIDRDGKHLDELRPDASSKPTFSPDGRYIVYSRHRRVNKYNAMQNDIHVYDLERKKEERLSEKLRASQPSFSPDGRKIVCVLNADGTHRLAVIDAEGGGEARVIYEREKGTQFYNPQYSPDGKRILFGIFEGVTRDIATIDADGGDFRYLVRTENDERGARWLPDGNGIVFVSDRTGIFNVYSTTPDGRSYKQLTNVIGGAFSPDISAADGSLVYSGYDGDGYHVSIVDRHSRPVAVLDENAYRERTMGELDECGELRAWNDAGGSDAASGIVAEPETDAEVVAAGGAEALDTDGPNADGADSAEASFETKDYEWTYSDLQIFPRVVIWDGTPRLGAFLGGSEILDKQFFFLGGSYGFDGRFDAFVDFELRQLFPVLFMEFIRMREITSDHVILEDDPVFDALNLDEVRYDLWAADMGLRFEFQDPFNMIHNNDFALWFSHGEYRVHIDWAGVAGGVEIPQNAVAWKYYVGNDLYARWRFKSIRHTLDAAINPRNGRQLTLQYMRAWDKLFLNGEFQYGLRPEFTNFDFNQYTVDYREYFGLPWLRHTLQLRLYGSFIDRPVDDFFWVYLGGMDGIRGYTYYSIGGRQGAIAGATYRFPLLRNIGEQLSWLTFRDVYGGVFFEAAKSWESHFEFNDLKRSVGAELRILLGSYYSYPTAIQFVAARSLDRSVFFIPAFDEATIHEPQWRYYFQVGFTF